MSQLQALIFDVDGTLADTERHGHRIAFNQAFAEAGLDWNWSEEQYGELLEIAGGKERIQFYRQTYCPEFQPAANIPVWAAELHRAKTRHYQALLQKGQIPLRPGVRRLIEQARSQGVKMAIATTSALENVIALLELALAPDSPNWFEIIAAGDMVAAKKPAPDIYLYALQAMQLSPANCLAIEDSYQGLQAAIAAGLKTVITLNGYTHSHDFSGATLVLDHLGEPDFPCQSVAGTRNAPYFDLALAQELLTVGNLPETVTNL